MMLEFSKYHGTGNDFILVDDRQTTFRIDRKLIAGLCHRRFGIGADGLILLSDAKGADFKMTYFNADGGEGSMCGNGGRCVAAFAHALHVAGTRMRFLACDGMHEAEITAYRDQITEVRLRMADVKDVVIGNEHYFINTGSPHHVEFVGNVLDFPVVERGKTIRYSAAYPAGTNVDFVTEMDDHLYVRTYERGVEDETLSCGTGVTAAALAVFLKSAVTGPVRVETPGGRLSVSFYAAGGSFSEIWLEGPAALVFQGSMDTESFMKNFRV